MIQSMVAAGPLARAVALAILLLPVCSCDPEPKVAPAPSIEDLQTRLAEDPESCRLNEQLGSTHLQQYRYPEAIAAFEASLAHCPDDPFTRFALGKSTLLAGACEQGEAIMHEAVRSAERQGDAEAAEALALELAAWVEKRDELPVDCPEPSAPKRRGTEDPIR